MDFRFQPIGVVRSCFPEKFGIPRQAGLITAAEAVVEILPPFHLEEAFRGLESFSHIWILFAFHALRQKKNGWQPCVRPPRLGGNRKIGVFASRSGFRPNPIGLSAVRLERIEKKKNRLNLVICGADLMDQTPVLDIKPYLPYADRIDTATGGIAPGPPDAGLTITFAENALSTCRETEKNGYPGLTDLIRQVLQNDPRPAYLANNPDRSVFGCRLYHFNIKWEVTGSRVTVVDIETS